VFGGDDGGFCGGDRIVRELRDEVIGVLGVRDDSYGFASTARTLCVCVCVCVYVCVCVCMCVCVCV
jgi:hypothetical protein